MQNNKSLIKEFYYYLKERKNYWLLPIVIMLFLCSTLLVSAAWYTGLSPVYEFELTPQNQSVDKFHNASFGHGITNISGIVGGSAISCPSANTSCMMNITNGGDINAGSTASIGFWLNWTTNSSYVFRKGTTIQYYAFMGANGTMEFTFNAPTNSMSNTGTVVSNGKDQCIVLVYNGTHQYAVINNVTDTASIKTRSGSITAQAVPVTFFSHSGGNPGTGRIDELFFSNNSMTTSDIQDFCSKQSTTTTLLNQSFYDNADNGALPSANNWSLTDYTTTVAYSNNASLQPLGGTAKLFSQNLTKYTHAFPYGVKGVFYDTYDYTNATGAAATANLVFQEDNVSFGDITAGQGANYTHYFYELPSTGTLGVGPQRTTGWHNFSIVQGNSTYVKVMVDRTVLYNGSIVPMFPNKFTSTNTNMAWYFDNLNISVMNLPVSNLWAINNQTINFSPNKIIGAYCDAATIYSSNDTSFIPLANGSINYTGNYSSFGIHYVQIGCANNEENISAITRINVTGIPINVTARQLYTNNTINSFNVTTPTENYTTTIGSTIINAASGTNNIQIAVPGNFSANASCTGTFGSLNNCTAQGIYDNRFTIGSKNFSNVNNPNFRVAVNNSQLSSISLSNQSTTNSSIVFSLLQGYYYHFYLTSSGYADQEITLLSSSSTQLYNFTLYPVNTMNITFFDENNGSIINYATVYLELISASFANNYSTTNGTLYFQSLSPATYTMRYTALNYLPRFYMLTLTNNSYNNLNLTLLKASEGTNVTITVVDDIGNPIENATVKVLKYDLTTNSYVVNQISTTNFAGVTIANVELNNEYYEFLVLYNGETVLVTTPSYVYSTSIELVVLSSAEGFPSYPTIQNATGIITYTNATSTASFTYTDVTNTITRGCLFAYKIIGGTQSFYNSTCASASSGTVLMSLENNTQWSYFLIGNVTLDGGQLPLATRIIGFDQPLPESTQKTGLFVLFLVIIVAAFISVYSIEGSVVMVGLGFLITSGIGITGIDTSVGVLIFVISIIVAGIIGWRGSAA